MHRLFLAAGLALAGLLLPATGQAQAPGSHAFEAAFGQCRGDVCVIRHNNGGEINRYIRAAQAVRAGAKRQVVIDGPCRSACAIFADIARERVCVTDRASFGFHKARLYQVAPARGGRPQFREIGRQDPQHSPDIAGWVHRNGGFPNQGYRTMNAQTATQFWRHCESR